MSNKCVTWSRKSMTLITFYTTFAFLNLFCQIGLMYMDSLLKSRSQRDEMDASISKPQSFDLRDG